MTEYKNEALEMIILTHLKLNVGREYRVSGLASGLYEEMVAEHEISNEIKEFQQVLKSLQKEGLITAYYAKPDTNAFRFFTNGPDISIVEGITKEGLQLIRAIFGMQGKI